MEVKQVHEKHQVALVDVQLGGLNFESALVLLFQVMEQESDPFFSRVIQLWKGNGGDRIRAVNLLFQWKKIRHPAIQSILNRFHPNGTCYEVTDRNSLFYVYRRMRRNLLVGTEDMFKLLQDCKSVCPEDPCILQFSKDMYRVPFELITWSKFRHPSILKCLHQSNILSIPKSHRQPQFEQSKQAEMNVPSSLQTWKAMDHLCFKKKRDPIRHALSAARKLSPEDLNLRKLEFLWLEGKDDTNVCNRFGLWIGSWNDIPEVVHIARELIRSCDEEDSLNHQMKSMLLSSRE